MKSNYSIIFIIITIRRHKYQVFNMRVVSLFAYNVILLIFLYHTVEYCYASAYIHIRLMCYCMCTYVYSAFKFYICHFIIKKYLKISIYQ